jgi:hypothetical protein
MAKARRDWLLVTVSTPGGGNSAERVYAWRALRRLGALYLQQSVCVLPVSGTTTAAIDRLLGHLHRRAAHGEVMRIRMVDREQEEALIERFQAERSDEYHEVVERTGQFHEELDYERRRGRVTYPELEESDADLTRHRKWLAAIEARDYFDAPGHEEAVSAVKACASALVAFEASALAAEFDDDRSEHSGSPGLRAVEGGSD